MDGGDLAIGGVGAGVGTDTGISSSSGRRALLESMRYWFRFIERCVQDRLDTERFESFARLVYAKHRLPPIILAGLFLRPQPHNRDSPDPRIPPYLKSLDGLGYIDTPATLRALYEFSSCHVLVDKQLASTTGQDGGSGDDENNKVVGEGEDASVKESDKNKRKRKPLRWRNSYWLEEATFYRLTKLVVEGRAVRDTKAALQIARILSQWMALFTAASATFTADLLAQTQQRLQEEMGSSRAGLVALLLRLSENLAFVSAISKPRAKGTC
jgi:mediator of RNA polymerase II transcription subunit 5